jgi:DeoR/GlpR family transcriptional regulator of sugar metabolism
VLQPERYQTILSLCESYGYVTIAQLMSAVGASKSTIHRDLEGLEKEHLLTRTRGGAVSRTTGLTCEPPILLRQKSHLEEKQRIAVAALRFIALHNTVLLDAGTTVHELGKLLAKSNYELMVGTNDLSTAYELSSNSNGDLICTGGITRKNSHTLVGHFAENVIDQLHADRFFLSSDAVSLEHGCMCYGVDEAQIKRAMLRASKETVLLSDHSKFGTLAFVNVCKLNEINLIITGKELPEAYAVEIRQLGIELILV